MSGFRETSFGPEEVIEVPLHEVRAGESGQLRIDIALPSGYHFNPQAPLTYNVEVSGSGISVANAGRPVSVMASALELPLAIPW